MRISLILLVLISFSCSTQKSIVGKYYHNNPFSSDTLEVYQDNTFYLFINKEMLQQKVYGTIEYMNGQVKPMPTKPQVGDYHEYKEGNAAFNVYDLLTNEKMCAHFVGYHNNQIVITGNTCDKIKELMVDSILFSFESYLPYEMGISSATKQTVNIYLAPDYYFLKDKYWEGWIVKKRKIITPHEEFKKE